ncbi:MAG: transcriptional regulator, TetR family [Conexibacter sp.]|nr:transcriptional regulator, TetR family [Conexibacter sp.]
MPTAVAGTIGAMANVPDRTPYPVAARRLLRDTLLDAMRDALAERSWAEVTMADVARDAGVSRQTLYKEFGTRDEFGQAFVVREGTRFLDAVEQAVRAHLDDPHTALGAAFDVFLTAAAEDPLVRMVLRDDGTGGLLPLVTTQSQPLVAAAAERLAAVMHDGWPQAARADVELLAESLVRLAISYAMLPKGPANMTAASVVTLLGPYLDRVLERP